MARLNKLFFPEPTNFRMEIQLTVADFNDYVTQMKKHGNWDYNNAGVVLALC